MEQALNSYWVRHIRAGIVEWQYEAQAVDAVAACTDAIGQSPAGCKVDVCSMDEWRRMQALEQHARSRETAAWHAENAMHRARFGAGA